MNIIILGGCGVMGSEIVNQLISLSDIEITIGDKDERNLQKTLERFGKRISTEIIDVNNEQQLISSLKNYDIVVSTIGPFYKYGKKIVEASIRSGVNCIDINDDYDAIQESLSLHKQAEKNGVTVITGLGASPGITNILAKNGSEKLDNTSEINIFWSESSVDPTGSAALEHWLHIISGEVPMFLNEKWVDVKGLSDPEITTFINPVGELKVYYTGHPEPVTLPKYIKDVKKVTIKGGLFPPKVMKIWKAFRNAGLSSEKTFIYKDLKIPLRELTVKLIRAMPYFAPEYFNELYKEAMDRYEGVAGALKVEVIGERNGNRMKITYDVLTDSVKFGTALPAALGTIMMIEGKINKNGVYAPEGAIDTKSFLTKIEPKIKIKEKEIKM